MKYDYIILLCADKKNEDGDFPEFRNGDYIGGKNRMNVALEYSLLNPGVTFIVTGGYNPDDGSKKYYSRKVADMVDFLKSGNPDIDIIEIPSLPCIRHNLIAIFNKMQNKLKKKRIAILTSYLYVPRTLAIWSKLGEEYPGLPIPHILCSESFLNNEEAINNNLDLYMKRIIRECQGLHDLELGEYEDFCLVTARESFLNIANKYPYLTSRQDKMIYGINKSSVSEDD